MTQLLVRSSSADTYFHLYKTHWNSFHKLPSILSYHGLLLTVLCQQLLNVLLQKSILVDERALLLFQLPQGFCRLLHDNFCSNSLRSKLLDNLPSFKCIKQSSPSVVSFIKLSEAPSTLTEDEFYLTPVFYPSQYPLNVSSRHSHRNNGIFPQLHKSR